MSKYTHRVNYYETDKMGITHHSNYIRFMEEARMNYLTEIGYPMTRLESEGVMSPVVSINCDYKTPTTYSDDIEIEVNVLKYSGVRLTLSYEMKNKNTGALVANATSVHCFINDAGKPVALKNMCPELDDMLKKLGGQ
ncbi:MAG: acyl-CoA thioesterase [Lachnospiraceae bacterium]|nr:acyl-CoA thioesterase [Lachnospiraceae bacterium]